VAEIITVKDRLTKARRSWNMSRIKGKNTSPEIAVRSALHRMGFRFRLHAKDLPGKPDIVLPKYKTVIFVHGCFWHRHKGCKNCTTPTNRKGWWIKKLNGNAERDKKHLKTLGHLGWRILVVWECMAAKPQNLSQTLLILTRTLRCRANSRN
jgi:DNA mismatch endonuclease (patch repair protein)